MTNLRNLSLFGVLFGFIVVALGAWTRLVDAGLGCPDWPGCYGFVVFPTSELDVAIAEQRFPQFPYDINKAIPEVVHRYFAATLGLVAIALSFLSFKQSEDINIRYWCLGLLVFICCQGVFGYLTVSLKLLPIIVTGHLFGGFITVSLFFFIFIRAGNFPILNTFNIQKVKYINDSKATNVNAVYYALDSMKNSTVWIVGGVDKGNNYNELLPLVREKVKAIICLGLDNKKIIETFSSISDLIIETSSMKEAVNSAYRIAKPNDVVLLSPACSSFDLFENYEDRGNQFKECVRKL